MADEQWYYAQQGQRLGPVATTALQGMLAQGTVSAADMVWREGMADWQPAANIQGLFAAPASYAVAPPGNSAQPGMMNYTPPPQQFTRYAGFWLRFVAMIIDTIILAVVNNVIGFFGGYLIGMSLARSGTPSQQIILTAEFASGVIGIVIDWLYCALMESSANQGTLGKMALGIKVTDLQGQRVTFGRASGRHFGKFISALIAMVGFIMAAFTHRKQALHDIMAGCLVVPKR